MSLFPNAIPNSNQLEELVAELSWLDQQYEPMVQLLIRLGNVNSGSMNLPGLESVRQILAEEYSILEGQMTTMEVDPWETVDDDGNLTQQALGKLIHISNRKTNCPTALLCIHMDTVYPENSKFQQCRKMADGSINGPGVADAKGGLVVMLYALKVLARSRWADRIGWEVIINPDEELGSPGSERFLKERAALADFGLLFEPTLPDGSLVSARKGVGNFSFIVRGKSVHAGREFDQGRNAVVGCCRLMNEIDSLNDDPAVTYNIGKISGGDALNVVPDLAVGRVNVRVTTREQMSLVEQKFEQLVQEYSDLDGIQVEMHGRFTSPPKELTPEIRTLQQLVQTSAQTLGDTFSWKTTGGASDGNKFAAAGLPNIDTLGPLGGAIHSENEYMWPESLVQKAKLTALCLMIAAEIQ